MTKSELQSSAQPYSDTSFTVVSDLHMHTYVRTVVHCGFMWNSTYTRTYLSVSVSYY